MPAHADAVVEELQIRRIGSNVNLRVSVRNPADIAQQGPIVIELLARARTADEWTTIRTWDDIKSMGPGDRLSRDFFEENSPLLTSLASNGKFQVKAIVRAPGLTRTVEKTSWFNTSGN